MVIKTLLTCLLVFSMAVLVVSTASSASQISTDELRIEQSPKIVFAQGTVSLVALLPSSGERVDYLQESSPRGEKMADFSLLGNLVIISLLPECGGSPHPCGIKNMGSNSVQGTNNTGEG